MKQIDIDQIPAKVIKLAHIRKLHLTENLMSISQYTIPYENEIYDFEDEICYLYSEREFEQKQKYDADFNQAKLDNLYFKFGLLNFDGSKKLSKDFSSEEEYKRKYLEAIREQIKAFS